VTDDLEDDLDPEDAPQAEGGDPGSPATSDENQDSEAEPPGTEGAGVSNDEKASEANTSDSSNEGEDESEEEEPTDQEAGDEKLEVGDGTVIIEVDAEAEPGKEGVRSDRDAYSAKRDGYSAGRDLKYIGRDNFAPGRDINFGSPPENPKFDEIAVASMDRLCAVFVEPPGYRLILQDVLRESASFDRAGILLIHGPDHAGKWTCAVNIASQLSRKVFEYSRPKESGITLWAAMDETDLPEESVVILRDCFERNVKREELEAARVEEILRPLRKKKIILVLTGDPPGDLEPLSVIPLSSQVENLHNVLESNLRYWVEHEGLLLSGDQVQEILGLWSKLEPFLATPFHINQFCSKLSRVTLDDKRKRALELVRIAKEVALGGRQATRGWFDALQPNEKFFGLLVYLLAGAERRWLEELGRQLVVQFWGTGFKWLSDPREQGLEDVREAIQTVERGGRLEFEDRLYEREVRWQVKNRQHLIWDFLNFLIDLEPKEAWSEGWKRQALGIALGRVGIHDHPRLEEILRDMGEDGDKQRAVIPGYTLQEMVREQPETEAKFAWHLLEAWIRSRSHRLMWAAGAASWRVYLAAYNSDVGDLILSLKSRVLKLLQLLGANLAAFDMPAAKVEGGTDAAQRALKKKKEAICRTNSQCVVEAMRQITLADPKLGAAELGQWMLRGKRGVPSLGCMTVRALYETFSRAQNRPNTAQQAPLLSLLSPLLETSEESLSVEATFLTLRGWLSWPELVPSIHSILLLIATYSTTQVRERLRSVLTRLWLAPQPPRAEMAALQLVRSSRNRKGFAKEPEQWELQEASKLVRFWCRDTEKAAYRIAQTVVVRCYAVEGGLPSEIGEGQGVVVLDPALLLPPQAGKPDTSNGLLWNLLALLESRMDVTLLRLGQTEPLDLFGASLSTIELLPRFAGHRLLMPGLEVRTTQRESVFVLASRKPVDFDDLTGQPWLRNLFYLGQPFERGEANPGGYVHLDVDWKLPQGLKEAVSALEDHWARQLASAPPAHWLELVRAFGIDERIDWSLQAESWARDLDSPAARSVATAEPYKDPVRRILALALWLAATDLPTCLAWIGSWLTPADSVQDIPAKRAMGAAAAFALIRLYTAYPPNSVDAERAPTLLFEKLAEPLGRRGVDGVNAVVRLVEHWLVDREWAEFLAGDLRNGRGRLERWTQEYLYDRPDLASSLADRVAASRVGGANESWVALAAAMDRLSALRALERPKALPDLKSGQLFAILVLGAGLGTEDQRRHLAAVAADLYGDLANREGVALVPALYRLGECRPFWAGSKDGPAPERLLPSGMRLSGLIGPLFEQLEGARDQISTVLLISGTTPIDLDDWVESAWWSKVRRYGGGAPALIASFATLPLPVGATTSPSRARFEAERVASYVSGLSLVASHEPVSSDRDRHREKPEWN
jgi:hypothetical protein